MPAAAERMSRVDTAWLRMDNDVNLMMIVGVWLLDPAIRYEALAERINDKLLKYGRFRQKVVQDAMGASWVDDDAFELANHVVKHTLRRRRGQSERAALQELAGELATTPLDPTRPLWQFHFIEHYEGGSALIARVHHCIADGIALISVMMSITDGGMDPPPHRARKTTDTESDWLTDAVVKPLTKRAVSITDPDRIDDELDQAIAAARGGRPGPVWMEVPLDIQAMPGRKAEQFPENALVVMPSLEVFREQPVHSRGIEVTQPVNAHRR